MHGRRNSRLRHRRGRRTCRQPWHGITSWNFNLLELYEANGSWEKAAGAWNGDRSGGYWRKVVTASNAIQKTKHVLQVVILLKLALICILFVVMGDKLSQLIIKQFGTSDGFKFLPGT